MKNVTITMDEEVARWARIEAARNEVSLSRFVGELVRERMAQEQVYRRQMQAFLSQKPTAGSAGRPLPRREEIHDRAVLRR